MTKSELDQRSIWKIDTFSLSPGALNDRAAVLTGEEARHASHVSRKRPGDSVRLIDGAGAEALAKIEWVSDLEVGLAVVEVRRHTRSDGLDLILVQGVLKGRSLEEAVRRSSEVGVGSIVPVTTARVVARPDGELSAERMKRLRAIAMGATKQSRGVFVPEILDVRRLDQIGPVLGECDRFLVAWEEEGSAGLREALGGVTAGQRIGLVVGPEGGLELDEIEALRAMGAVSVSVGRRILKADWAGAAVASMISHEVGGLLP